MLVFCVVGEKRQSFFFKFNYVTAVWPYISVKVRNNKRHEHWINIRDASFREWRRQSK